MLNRLQLFRNIGQFDSVDTARDIPLAKLTLIYAENGRGKTTLAAVLRSLGSGDPVPITERRRLAAVHAPHVVLECAGGPPAAMFQNGAWNRTLPNLVVFDDMFVDANVYSGLAVEPGHRQRLHDLILGARGVALNAELQRQVDRIEQHNLALRQRENAIPAAARGGLSVEQFVALAPVEDIESAVDAATRNLEVARQQEAVRLTDNFEQIRLPAINIDRIAHLLAFDLPALDAQALAAIQNHLATLGADGEPWLADGVRRIHPADTDGKQACPFCAQDLRGSELVGHYRAYFGAAYANLKQDLAAAIEEIESQHGGDSIAAFQRAVQVAQERHRFWSQFLRIAPLQIDAAQIGVRQRAARDAVLALLRRKQAAPLERIAWPDRQPVVAFNADVNAIDRVNETLLAWSAEVVAAKAGAAQANLQAATNHHAEMVATRHRHSPAVAPLCEAYAAEVIAKADTEQLRNQAREALEQYRQNVFPVYERSINEYLSRFNAGFKIVRVTPQNIRGGSTCTYAIAIQDNLVAVGAINQAAGQPSFRNVLSAGDRSTLALAFFFAALDREPKLANHIVVIDDPITSLDEHRSVATVAEILRLADRTSQIIVLAHTKPVLCQLWEGADRIARTALIVLRAGDGSIIQQWDVNQDLVTDHDHRHALLRGYIQAATPNNRPVAAALRPVLERYVRVAFPEHFPPGSLLGNFLNICDQRAGGPAPILRPADARELRELTNYANLFHHDTNEAWLAVVINDQQLLAFVRRTIAFTRR